MKDTHENPRITAPDAVELDRLCTELSGRADTLDASGEWAREQLELCGAYGVYEWFLPRIWGGQEWDELDVVRAYLRLSAACLTTTFILTQRTGACRRIASSDNEELKAELLPRLARNELFASVGISHLTTSRRHLTRPALAARPHTAGFVLDGFSPWVTGGIHCDVIVTGATLDDGRQILAAVPADLKGIHCPAPPQLVGVSSSHTGKVEFDNVLVQRHWLIGGPMENIMAAGTGARTGGLETSTLALGVSTAAVTLLEQEAGPRAELEEVSASFRRELDSAVQQLIAAARGEPHCSTEQLRTRANSLVLRSTQAALTAAKGTGYVRGHPAGRWCREALFFLVWSCPQPVARAALCELAALGFE